MYYLFIYLFVLPAGYGRALMQCIMEPYPLTFGLPLRRPLERRSSDHGRIIPKRWACVIDVKKKKKKKRYRPTCHGIFYYGIE